MEASFQHPDGSRCHIDCTLSADLDTIEAGTLLLEHVGSPAAVGHFGFDLPYRRTERAPHAPDGLYVAEQDGLVSYVIEHGLFFVTEYYPDGALRCVSTRFRYDPATHRVRALVDYPTHRWDYDFTLSPDLDSIAAGTLIENNGERVRIYGENEELRYRRTQRVTGPSPQGHYAGQHAGLVSYRFRNGLFCVLQPGARFIPRTYSYDHVLRRVQADVFVPGVVRWQYDFTFTPDMQRIEAGTIVENNGERLYEYGPQAELRYRRTQPPANHLLGQQHGGAAADLALLMQLHLAHGFAGAGAGAE
jgi:hypothetical protein